MSKIYQKKTLDGKTRQKRHFGGFTLVELLVVVLIIGILAAVALPKYQRAVQKAHFTQLITTAKSLYDAQQRYFLANSTYSNKLENLDISFGNAPGDDMKQEIRFNVGSCWLNYDSADVPARIACSMHSPKVFYAYSLPEKRRYCCVYAEDNYAGDWLCRSIMNNQTSYDGCGEGQCRCYR